MRWLWPLAVSLAVVLAVGLTGVSGAANSSLGGHRAKVQEQQSRPRRGTKDEGPKEVQHYVPQEWAEYPRPIHPAGLQPTKTLVATSPNPDKDGATPDSGQELRANLTGTPSQRLQIQNPLYPVTESSYSAYAVMLLALVVFAVGIVGNLSVMCIVWHSYYLKSAWNSILASLALWDFLVLFFCLPIVIFNEITKQRLLGDVSCRAVPFMEVRLSFYSSVVGLQFREGAPVPAETQRADLQVCLIPAPWGSHSTSFLCVIAGGGKLYQGREQTQYWLLVVLRKASQASE